jgi:hypothetical protein
MTSPEATADMHLRQKDFAWHVLLEIYRSLAG